MSHKILLVDDEFPLVQNLAELLSLRDFEVKTASNGEEAITTLNYWIPDLIVSDIMMPKMDGYLFLDLIRQNASLCSIPVVFISAKNSDFHTRNSMLKGADDFLSKPFKIEDLIKVIEARLKRFQKIKSSYDIFNIKNTKNSLLEEMNKPLLEILNATKSVLDSNNEGIKTELEQYYNSISNSGRELNRTLQNLILYHQIQNHFIDTRVTDLTSIEETFLMVKENLSQIYETDCKRLYFDIDPCVLKIPKTFLSFILYELIDNALKFSVPTKRVIVVGRVFDIEKFQITIKDNGFGFESGTIQKINPYQQFNNDKKHQGLGLGLYLSISLLHLFKGSYTIQSKKGEGTTFKLYFPLQNP